MYLPSLKALNMPLFICGCLHLYTTALSYMHLHSLVGVSTLVNYNERHVDKVI